MQVKNRVIHMIYDMCGSCNIYVDGTSYKSCNTCVIHHCQVQHLIEECILFNMSKEECMDALAKHANILPVITSTGKSDLYLILYSVYCNFVETWLMLFGL